MRVDPHMGYTPALLLVGVAGRSSRIGKGCCMRDATGAAGRCRRGERTPRCGEDLILARVRDGHRALGGLHWGRTRHAAITNRLPASGSGDTAAARRTAARATHAARGAAACPAPRIRDIIRAGQPMDRPLVSKKIKNNKKNKQTTGRSPPQARPNANFLSLTVFLMW
jgi:hypothetical protein